MTEKTTFDIVVIGAGPVGLFATSKFQTAGFHTILLEASDKIGGQLNLYLEKEVHNIPLIDSIKAGDLIDKMVEKIERRDIKTNTKVIDIVREDDGMYKIITSNNEFLYGKYVIFACGNGEILKNKLLLQNATIFENKTLFYEVNYKQKFFFKDVVIAGGGDSVIDWAVELANSVNSLTIIHRREINKIDNQNFKTFQQLVLEGKIILKTPYQISKINAKQGAKDEIENIEIANIDNKNVETLKTDYLIVFFGLQAGRSEVLQKYQAQVNQANSMSEASENVFFVGDCCKYNGKLKVMPIGFSEVLKCFTYICQKEKNGINMYGKSTTRQQ